MTRSGDKLAANSSQLGLKGQTRGRMAALEEAYGEIPVVTAFQRFNLDSLSVALLSAPRFYAHPQPETNKGEGGPGSLKP